MRKNAVFLVLVATLALAISGCLFQPAPTPAPTKATLTGQVVVPEEAVRQVGGQFLSGATVNIIDPKTGEIIATTKTDANGKYQAEIPPGGPYIIEAVKSSIKVLDVSPPVEVGKTYDLGTADDISTAVALVFKAKVEVGEDPAQINLDEILEDPKIEELAQVVKEILLAGKDPTTAPEVTQVVEVIVTPPVPSTPTTPSTPTYNVTFIVTPEDAIVKVKASEGNVVTPVAARIYKLAPGTYAYTVSKTGYVIKKGNFTVVDKDLVIEVNLKEKYHTYELKIEGLADQYIVRAPLIEPKDADFEGMTPVKVKIAIKEENDRPYEGRVRIAPLFVDYIQLWAKDTAGNWYDISQVGWGPPEGFPIDLDAEIDVYVIVTTSGRISTTLNLIDVTGDYGAPYNIMLKQPITIKMVTGYHFYKFDIEGLADQYIVREGLTQPEDTDFEGMTPVKVKIAIDQQKDRPYEGRVRIAPVGAEDIQLWAKDTADKWWDINEVGWGPPEGFPIDLDAEIDVYVIATQPGTITATLDLIDVTGDYEAPNNIMLKQPITLEAVTEEEAIAAALQKLKVTNLYIEINNNVVTATVIYPTTINPILESWLADAKLEVDKELPAGTTVDITYNGIQVASGVSVSGTKVYLSALLPGNNRPSITAHAGKTDTWVVTITPGALIDTTLTVKAVISKNNNFATEEVIAEDSADLNIAPTITLSPATGSSTVAQGGNLQESQITLSSNYNATGLKTVISLKKGDAEVNFSDVFESFNLQTGEDDPYNMVGAYNTFQYGPSGGYSVIAGVPQVTTVTGKVKSDASVGTYTIITEIEDAGGKVLATATYTLKVTASA